ncbi:MAG: V4R domain-containing protein [Halobacteriota archaeon]|nr:V4R domain-containing protein [Halobacteriota archaeon]
MSDSEIYDKVYDEVSKVLDDSPSMGFSVWRGMLVDLQAVMETVIPYDIRYGGLPSFYEAGVKSGEEFGRWVIEQFDLEEKSIKERTRYVDALLDQLNIGKPEYVGSTKEGNVLRFDGGTMFAKEYKKVGRNVCYHGAGFTAGSTSVIAGGRKFKVRETSCVAAGDPYCEFVISLEEK